MSIKALTLLATLMTPIVAFSDEISGTASYRERIALPQEATFQAILFNVSKNKQIEVGRFESKGDAGPPYRFSINYPVDAVSGDGLYAIQAKVIWQDRAFVAAGTMLERFPASAQDINLVMVRPGISPAAAVGLATSNKETVNNMISAPGLKLPASFVGTVQDDERAETWHLTLFDDQVFQLVRTFKNEGSKNNSRSSLGRWHADPSANALMLHDGAEMPLKVSITGAGALQVIDANTGTANDGALTPAAVELVDLNDMLIAGMMTYMADAAILEECKSGARFPITKEGDYLALETAYLKDRPGPGEPLYIMMEGSIAMRPAMEGPDRQFVVIERFIRTRTGISCARQRADAHLRNTYWRLDELDGTAFPQDVAQREPHLILETSESGKYRATVGCNRMRGGYKLEQQGLTFSPAASTMMACPEPLNSIEQQFNKMLAEVAGYAIEGETLILKDAANMPIATFTGVYF